MAISLKFRSKTSRSDEVLERYKDKVSQIVKKTAFDVEADAKSLAPEDTGHLKGSIEATPTDSELTWRVMVGASYGRFVEFGTRRMAAQPYLTPAVERNRKIFREVINRFIGSRR